jgi:hypothetical protein
LRVTASTSTNAVSLFIRPHNETVPVIAMRQQFLLTKDDQGILSVGLGRTLCAWHLIRFSHRHTEDNFQMSFQETRRSGFNRYRASN